MGILVCTRRRRKSCDKPSIKKGEIKAGLFKWKVRDSTYQAVGLLGPGASSCTEEVTALTRLGSKASATVTLRTAVDLGKLLAILGPFTPTTGLTRLVTGGAISFGLAELVDIVVLGILACDDLLPFNGLDVAQIVVVHNAHAALENVCKQKSGGRV